MNAESKLDMRALMNMYLDACDERSAAIKENTKLKQEAALYIQGKSSELRQMVSEYLEDAQ